MKTKLLWALCLASGLLVESPIQAQTADTTLPETEAEQPETTTDLESEDPAADADAEAEQASDQPPAETPDLQLVTPFNSPFSQQNFVPDIALILDSSIGAYNLGNEDLSALNLPLNLRDHQDNHHLFNGQNGFNFNYAELTLSSTVDPYFDLFSTFHLSAAEFEVEEAYFNTRSLPFNLQFKGGKFLSHFGRLNSQHAHFWSFNDQPLIYRNIFGSEGLNEIGARLSWLAPTDFYLDLGLELLQGANSESFGTQGFTLGDQKLPEVNRPNLLVATVKSSVDLTDNLVLLGGLSYAQGGARLTEAEEEGEMHVHQAQAVNPIEYYAGLSQVAGADLSLRWFIDSYQELSWQSEFLLRSLSGSQYGEAGRQALGILQSGFYSQLIWRFAQQWRTGLRLDLATQNQRSSAGSNQNGLTGWPRYSAMLEYTPSEFSRFRLQYNLDQSQLLNGSSTTLHSIFLNLNLAMGAHGAHAF